MSDGARIKTLDTAPDLAALRDLIRAGLEDLGKRWPVRPV